MKNDGEREVLDDFSRQGKTNEKTARKSHGQSKIGKPSSTFFSHLSFRWSSFPWPLLSYFWVFFVFGLIFYFSAYLLQRREILTQRQDPEERSERQVEKERLGPYIFPPFFCSSFLSPGSFFVSENKDGEKKGKER